MKALSAAFAFLLPLTLLAGEVKTGDSLDTVRANLGGPRGELHLGGRDVFYFDRGEVELHSGVVTRVALRSAEVQAQLEAKRTADDLRIREMLETRRTQLTIEGETLKARQLADPTFLSSPLGYQVAFWRNFSVRYTGVTCVEQLNIAQAKYYEQEASDRRVAELEARAQEERERAYIPVYGTDYSYRNARNYRRPYHHYDRNPGNCDDVYHAYRSEPTRHWSGDRSPAVQYNQPVEPTRTAISPAKTSGEDWLGVPRFVPLNPQIRPAQF